MNDIPQGPVVHILKEGRSYCGMPGVPKDWPDNHLWLSFQDEANAAHVNCPECIERRRSGPHLAERLNAGLNREVLPYPDGKGGVYWSAGRPPEGVSFNYVPPAGESRFEYSAVEEKTGQAASYDMDLGGWVKVGI